MRVLIIGKDRDAYEWERACAGHTVRRVDGYQPDDFPEFSPEIVLELELRPTDGKRRSLMSLCDTLPPDTPILSNTLCVTATEIASWIGNCDRVVGFGSLPTLTESRLVEVAFPEGSREPHSRRIMEFFHSVERVPERIADSIGMVFPRMIAMIVNEAFFALQQDVADADAVDTAMKLATNYPRGPFEWGRAIGISNILAVLESLHRECGDDRYRPCPLIRKHAFLSAADRS